MARSGLARQRPAAPPAPPLPHPGPLKALDRGQVEALLTHQSRTLRERALFRLLYESAARAEEALALDVDDLDLRNRRAKVRRKGGALDVIVWRTATARLLPRLLNARRAGAAELFERATAELPGGPNTLHQLRHSALTHAAGDGANTSTLLAYSGHTSVTSLVRYARVSPEALARWQEGRDPASRRG
ncbi:MULTISPECIES: tyrosine-type recombinase/integrase [unclassified Nonomuraea]|uniref:tyrosine-type recombinase/integrase n=1 Tax=unclassified Nonomuraea TaxID=2593643 RepID=UPI0033CDFF58